MIGNDGSDDERGQAYTLEGIIGAMILLTAVLMALNSAVLLPSTSGDIDRGVQSDAAQQATDVLRIAHEDGNLSTTIRCWDPNGSGETVDDGAFYGSPNGQSAYNTTDPMDNTLGTMLNQTFTERFSSYKLEALYRGEDGADGGRLPIVDQGASVQNSITVSQTVTLYNDDKLVDCNQEPPASGEDPSTVSPGEYPIPNANEGSHIYNVVEVRLTIIW